MANLRLQQLDLLSGPATPHFQQSVDDGIQIDLTLVSHDLPPLTRDGVEGRVKKSRRRKGEEGERKKRETKETLPGGPWLCRFVEDLITNAGA